MSQLWQKQGEISTCHQGIVAFQKAIALDRAIRKLPGLKSETFLHDSRKPLDSVDLDAERPQLDLFQNECYGICGA